MNPQLCFRVYRATAKFSRQLELWGAWWLSEAVYRLLPMPVVRIGYDVWQREHRADFDAFIRRGGAE